MAYEDIFIAHVLNYLLADGFDASGEDNVLVWLGEGKTLADMLGTETSEAFYTPERKQQVRDFLHAYDLMELQHYVNNSDRMSAVVVRMNQAEEFVFSAGNPAGEPAITTDWFKRDRAAFLGQAT